MMFNQTNDTPDERAPNHLMISLKTKILGIITILVVAVISVSAFLNLEQQKRIITSIAEHNTAMLAETIKGSITDAMLAGHSEEIRKIFSHISNQKTIKTLRIIDESGKVLNSPNPGEIGTTAFSNSLLAYREGTATTGHLLNDRTYVSITPILNAPVCNNCHDSNKKVLGLLEIETSLDYINGVIADNSQQTLLATTIIIMLLLLPISFFLLAYLDRPIRSLVASMQKVEQGEFTNTPIFSSSKEMNLLSRHYNRMVKRLQLLMDTAVKNEGELVRAQEKLQHHHETQLMNEQLGEQIKEIEALNISLEERIEEIEEANYKIADLAGELEDKNSTLERVVARLSTLHKLGLGISSTMEIAPLFGMIVKSSMETLQAQIGFITINDPDDDTISIATIRGYKPEQSIKKARAANSLHVPGWVMENGKPLLIPDISLFPQFPEKSPLGFIQKTVLSVPLATKGQIIGTLNVVNRLDGVPFTNEDLELLTTIAGQASIAINNARLYDEQQRTYLNTIQSLVSAIEASDSYTKGHSERVTYYSLLLAKWLDLPAERLKVIERAAILHDIGKIGIECSVLHKNETLSPTDIHQLREHPGIGMRILEPISFLQDVRICIGQHHERYDGKGYPNRHDSETLLLESRILTIADAFDAMTSDRPYRQAMPVEVAIQELRAHAGTQFDPDLVQQFITALGQSGHFDTERPVSFAEEAAASYAAD